MTRLDDLRSAYDGQLAGLLEWLQALPAGSEDQPSRLPGWTVRELAFHTTEVPRALTRAVAAERPTERPQSIATYTSRWQSAAADIVERDRTGARGQGIETIIARHATETVAMHRALESVDGSEVVVAARRGPIRLSDLLVTRIDELVVHSLDLAASLPDLEPVAIDRQALGIAARMLTGILAERVPGHTVEVRVPPYAAVQCVEGPRHTRGTPANVVEVDAVSWIELATGRLSWRDAADTGRLRASGERSDISEHLPVLS